MNKARRSQLEILVFKLDEIITEESEAFDNLPESFQCSENGELMEGYVDQMGEAKSIIEEIAGI